MKKVYQVAGHKFALVVPDGDRVWDEMQKYEPFLSSDEDNCVFVAELVDEMPDTKDKQLVVVGNQGEDMPRVEL